MRPGKRELRAPRPKRQVGTGGPVHEKGKKFAESGEDPSAGISQLNSRSFIRHNDTCLYNII